MNGIPTVIGKKFPCMSSISSVRILTEKKMTAEFLKNFMIIPSADELIKFIVGCVYSLTSSPHAGLLRLCLSNSYANFAKGQLISE